MVSNQTNSGTTNDILESLGETAESNLREREEQRKELISQSQNKQKYDRSKRKKNKNREKGNEAQKPPEKQNTGDLEGSGSVSFDEAMGMAKSSGPNKQKSAPERDTVFEYSDPFDDFAGKMQEEGATLARPAPSKTKEKKNTGFNRRTVERAGEEVTKERAEKIISEGKSGVHYRGKIIVHTKVVDTSGNPVKETEVMEEPPKSEVRDIQSPEAEEKPAEKAPAPSLSLVRVDTGEVYEIDRDLTIGRHPDNDISIPRPAGHYVTEHHARIYISGRDVFVQDLDSRNGTYFNERKIGRMKLKAGMRIEFADIAFEVIEN